MRLFKNMLNKISVASQCAFLAISGTVALPAYAEQIKPKNIKLTDYKIAAIQKDKATVYKSIDSTNLITGFTEDGLFFKDGSLATDCFIKYEDKIYHTDDTGNKSIGWYSVNRDLATEINELHDGDVLLDKGDVDLTERTATSSIIPIEQAVKAKIKFEKEIADDSSVVTKTDDELTASADEAKTIHVPVEKEEKDVNEENYWQYFNENGEAVEGQILDKDSWYYLQTGNVVVGWCELEDINGNKDWYYFDENGKMLADTITPDGYYVNSDGKQNAATAVNGPTGTRSPYPNTIALRIENATVIWNYLKNKGQSDIAIAGVLGNFQRESWMWPECREVGGTGYGLAQQSHDQKYDLFKYANEHNKYAGDIITQLDFMTTDRMRSAFVNYYKTAPYASVQDATIDWMRQYERPRESTSGLWQIRIPYANAYYDYFVNGKEFKIEYGASIANPDGTMTPEQMALAGQPQETPQTEETTSNVITQETELSQASVQNSDEAMNDVISSGFQSDISNDVSRETNVLENNQVEESEPVLVTQRIIKYK